MNRWFLALLAGCAIVFQAQAQTPAEQALEKKFLDHNLTKFTLSAIGVTRNGTPIPCLVSQEDFDLEDDHTRVLLVGGLDGSEESVDAALAALDWYRHEFGATRFRERFLVSAVPCANPEGFLAKSAANGFGGDPSIGYPPTGAAYHSKTDPEAHYLWRWIGMHAPDFVIDLRGGSNYERRSNQSMDTAMARRAALVGSARILPANELASALCANAAGETGAIPAIQVSCGGRNGKDILADVLRQLQSQRLAVPSPARVELRTRTARSPLRVALQLSEHYGHKLSSVAYQPALALVARARLSEITGDKSHLDAVERIVAPYLNGGKPSFGKRVSGSHLSGHLIFGELARQTGNKNYIRLAKAAADHGFDANGAAKEAMPYHSEMSDAVFMSCPILAQTGSLTGDRKYFQMCLKHLRFMQGHCLRDDGLYRHSPLDQAAWGRGNGFPALGLAWSLSYLPEDFDGRYEILGAYRKHMSALARHQDPNGMWHQVVDHPESYREMTSSCMITFAMVRGLRNNWLNPEGFEPIVERAWNAIKTRIASNGRLVDVCTGTGKQKDLRAYFDRTAILGPDERGGAMAFMVAAEMAAWEKERRK